ncbi:MAG: gamma carbonic anhydrase family protein [Planctomycetales bacterium]|nr:gamma carbonic anhydrase family protein [Planctomycetales bacterium]
MHHSYRDYAPQIGERVFFAPSCDVIGRYEIGDDSSVWFQTVIRADVHWIKIGARTSVQDGTIVHVTHHKRADMTDGYPTVIGDDVTIGHRAMLHGCTIEDACLIGMGAILLDGAHIGKESIVAAGTLAPPRKRFPPRSLLMGSPAKVVRELTDDEVRDLYASAQRYVDYKNVYLDAAP